MDRKGWCTVNCIMVTLLTMCEFVVNRTTDGCFPLYAYRDCEDGRKCEINNKTRHVYEYEETPQNISINISCENSTNILIHNVTYLLPRRQHDTCIYTRQYNNTDKCTKHSKCTCCGYKSTLKKQSLLCSFTLKKHKPWLNKCDNKQGHCALIVPRRKMSTLCPLNYCERSTDTSKCYSRWVEIHYSCQSSSQSSQPMVTRGNVSVTTSQVPDTNKSLVNTLSSNTILMGTIIGALIFCILLIIIVTMTTIHCIRSKKNCASSTKSLSDSASVIYYNLDSNYGNDDTIRPTCSDNKPLKKVLNNAKHTSPQSTENDRESEAVYNQVGEQHSSAPVKTKLADVCSLRNQLSPNDKIYMTENAYYESIELKNPPESTSTMVNYSTPDKTVKNKLVNLFKQTSDKEKQNKPVYDYAYQHFQLEGRKRSPHKT